uniref:Uncharacterized protein n=1 Tax=Physcomitrium patens TaxID=3218 RepID=A0A2K1KAL1_PHYPA|nr:hypothetical protein PHYPA_010010 [Physcomitrium patens]
MSGFVLGHSIRVEARFCILSSLPVEGCCCQIMVF